MEMWAAHFSNRSPEHYVFPSEKYGAGTDDFKPCVYGTDVTKPIKNWKEAWEEAKRRAGAVLQEPRDAELSKAGERKHSPLQYRFHALRHTACTRLLEGGVPHAVVATIMGRSASTAIRMAKRYGHIGQKAMRQAMAVLEIAELPWDSPRIPQSRIPLKLRGAINPMKRNGSSGRTRIRLNTLNKGLNRARSAI